MPLLKPDELIDERAMAISALHESINNPGAELDLSGGIDSAVMAGLLTVALGRKNITLVYSSINSGAETLSRATDLAEALDLPLITHDLSPTYDAMVSAMIDNLVQSGHSRAEIMTRIESDPTVLGSLRSCLRAPLGRGYLRLTGSGIRHGTGNECEDRWLRFYQKGGDGEVDTNPLSMLAKGEVFQLALALAERLNAEETYRRIINAQPTPELWGAEVEHTDESEIGSYLRVHPGTHSFYSYINSDTGQYRQVGLIERVARFNDTDAGKPLFDDTLNGDKMANLCEIAKHSEQFNGVEPDLVAAILTAARRAEAATRHKLNPMISSLGSRAKLKELGLLSDSLI